MRVIEYEWCLRDLMNSARLFKAADIQRALKSRYVDMSYSQVYRLVTEKPDLLNLHVLVALMDILKCSADDLIRPVAANTPSVRTGTALNADVPGGSSALRASGARPKRAQILPDAPT